MTWVWDWHCPGCGAPVDWYNAAGYRTWCETCYAHAPEIPRDGSGYVLVGESQNLRWESGEGEG